MSRPETCEAGLVQAQETHQGHLGPTNRTDGRGRARRPWLRWVTVGTSALVLPHFGALVGGDAGFFTGFILATLSALIDPLQVQRRQSERASVARTGVAREPDRLQKNSAKAPAKRAWDESDRP